MEHSNLRSWRVFFVELIALFFWAVILIAILFRLHGGLFGIDDAHIFFTYSEHLARGEGLIYANTIPVVEGYTSTLWMLITAVVFFLGWGEFGVLVLATIIFIATQFFVFRLIDKVTQTHKQFLSKCIYLALLSSSSAYLSWTTVTLMDTGLWSFVIVAMAYSLSLAPTSIGQRIIGSIPFAIAPLVRPEGFFLGPTLLLLYWVLLRPQGAQRKFLFTALIMTFCSMISITVFRFWYFGFPLPNTFYAKVSNSWTYNIKEGLLYFYQYVTGSPILSLAILSIVILGLRFFLIPFIRPRHDSLSRESVYNSPFFGIVSILIISILMLPILLGGDHFHWFRFYQPIYPLLCFLLTCTTTSFVYQIIDTQLGWKAPIAWLTFFSFFGIFTAWLFYFSGSDSWYLVRKHGSPIMHEFRLAQEGKDKGLLLNQLFINSGHIKPAIGVYIAGGIARTYKGPIYDLMGLNNQQIAHFPGDRKGIKNHAAFETVVFYELPVDLLLSTPDSGFEAAIFKGLFTQPDFGRYWDFGVVRSKSNPNLEVAGFYKKTFVLSLASNDEIEFLPKKYFDSSSLKWISLR
jgi:hypothetical protein